jgi:hypothetical protein
MAQISHEVTLFLSINFSETCVQVQYDFVHESLSELVVCGETDIVAADIRIIINQMMRQVAGDTETTGFQKEFQTLEKVSAQYKASYQEAEAHYNASKNRFPDNLPSKDMWTCL